jgi:hypothetical protein
MNYPVISFMNLLKCLTSGTKITINVVNDDWEYSGTTNNCYKELWEFGKSPERLVVAGNSVYMNNSTNVLEIDCYNVEEPLYEEI